MGIPRWSAATSALIYCKDLAATINLVSLLPEFNDPRARQLFEEFSCPGGRSTELGDIHDVLLETCAAGKAFACGLRERL